MFDPNVNRHALESPFWLEGIAQPAPSVRVVVKVKKPEKDRLFKRINRRQIAW